MIANTHRFFVEPDLLAEDTVMLTDRDLVHQLQRVLRLRVGDRILLLDGRGSQSEVTLSEISRDRVCAVVETRTPAAGESLVAVHVFAALIRAERYEWFLQKAVELGAVTITPLVTAHTTATDAPSAQRMQRWQRIIREAAEQSCRGRLPLLQPAETLSQALTRITAVDLAIILEQHAEFLLPQLITARPDTRSVALFSGPEGGFSAAELRQAEQHGMIGASLGRRVLRAETAPLAALAVLSQLYDA